MPRSFYISLFFIVSAMCGVSHAAEESPSGAPSETLAPENPAVESQGSVTVKGRAIGGYSVFEASTATKTDTPIMEIPQSIQVIPEQVFLDQQTVEIGEVLENISGVQASGTDRAGLVDLFTVRGFQLNVASNFYKNGRPFIFSVQPPTEILERVEFLKGPASVLYGQSEPGGIVNMVLKQPTTKPFIKATLQGGSYDFYKAHIDTGGPIGETLGYRINLSRTDTGSFRDFHEKEQSVAAGTLEWDPAPWMEFSLNSSYQKRDQQQDTGTTGGPGRPGQSGNENNGVSNRVADIPISRSLNEPWTRVNTEAKEVGYDLKLFFSDAWQLRHSGNWQYQENDELRADPLSVIAADDPINGDFRGDLARTLRDRRAERGTFYFEASLLGEFDFSFSSHKLLIGADYFDSEAGFTEFDPDVRSSKEFNIFNPVYTDAPPLSLGGELFRTSRGELTQKGVYAQEQLTLFEWIHFLAGVRYDTFLNKLESTFFNPATQVPSGPVSFFDAEQSDTTYRVGLLVNPWESTSLFGSFAQSFKPNIAPFVDQLIDPEEAEQWEVGLKLSLLDGFLITTLTAFDLTKTNIVISNPVSQIIQIAGKRGAKGIEWDAVGELVPGWNLVANYAYLDAEVIEGDPRPGGTPGVGTVPIEGNTPPASPRHSGKLWMTYQFQDPPLLGFRFGGGFFARSQTQGDLFNTIQHPGFARFDAMLGWAGQVGGNNVDFQLNIKNVFGKEYFNGINRNFIKIGDPFTVLGQLSVAL